MDKQIKIYNQGSDRVITKKNIVFVLIVSFSFFSSCKDQAEMFLQPRSCVTRSLVKEQDFVTEKRLTLFRLIKEVDQALNYWQGENYRESRAAWYQKRMCRWGARQEYRKKILQSIDELQKIKQTACAMLGLLSAYSDVLQNNQQAEAAKIYAYLQDLSLCSPTDHGLELDRLINSAEQHVSSKHLDKYWKSYLGAAVSLASAAALYVAHKDIFYEKCSAVSSACSQWWHNALQAIQEWRETGMVGRPLKIVKDNPRDPRGQFYISDLPDITVEDLPALRVVVDQNMYIADIVKVASQGDSIHLGREDFVALYNQKLVPLFSTVREQLIASSRELEQLVDQKRRDYAILFCLAASSKILLAATGCLMGTKLLYSRFYVKKDHRALLRDSVKKMYDILHGDYASVYEQHGALCAQAKIFLESTSSLPTDIDQTLWEDVVQLTHFLVSQKRKQQIIQGWYNCYHFLQP
jgi:hypothetical protein